MKNGIKIIIIVIIGILLLPNIIQAYSYKIRELVPIDSSISINTNHFGYKEVKYEDDKITFYYIKNLTEKELPVSISIGLFDKDKKNIGTINICEQTQKLASKEEKAFILENISYFLGNKKKAKDIKYIAILGDNYSCRTHGSEDFLGQKIEEIGKFKTKVKNQELDLFSKVLIGLGALVIIPIIYKITCTNSFKNMDGEDVRKDFQEWQENKKALEAQEIEILDEPKPEKKSYEIIEQEKEAAEESSNETELHNLYK